jgi:prepilin-type N-terminal cleavage/methylation domain-containing protein
MTRQRGFTIVEVLVALFVASLLSVFVLSLTRSQLVTYEMQGQVNSTQQNIRESFDYVETTLRKACAGVSEGKVRVQLSDATKFDTTCIKVYDGAIFGVGTTTPAVGSIGSFQYSVPATKADAIEIIYGDGSGLSVVTAPPAGGQLFVGDATPFSQGDFILVTDMKNGYIFKIQSITTAGAAGTVPTGTITLDQVAGNPSDSTISNIVAGSIVMPAKSVAFYVDISTDTRNPMLMLDPDGVIGSSHGDAQPLAEGVEDLQIAVGFDGLGTNAVDGVIVDNANGTDEWIGNAGTTEYTTNPGLLALNANSTTWYPSVTTNASPRQIRLTMIVRSLNQYAGTAAALNGAENRNTVFGGSTTVASRYRQLRAVVAPRAWNPTE